MSDLRIVLLDDEEIDAIKSGGLWTDSGPQGAVLVAHVSQEQAVVAAAEQVMEDE
jgi:hypothetical protein